MVTSDADSSRAISVAPVQAHSNEEDSAMRIAFQSRSAASCTDDAIAVASRQIDDATIVIGYSQSTIPSIWEFAI